MCTIFANQHHRNKNVQVTGWLYIRIIEIVLLCWHMHRRSSCHDRTTVCLIARIKEVAPESLSMHCILHVEMLARLKMLSEFTSVLNDVVKVINNIKRHAHNSRLLEQTCEDMDAENRRLLLYA